MQTPAIIASLPAHPSLGQNLQFILVGFCFVILVLLVLAGITQMIGLAFKQPAKAKPVVAAKSASPAVVEAPVDETVEELDPAITAVIVAAAVHTVLGNQPHRILSIRPEQQSWAQEGRRQIFSSHSVR
ncbi:OadG family protein [Cerasicoccus frondis]|uniref:OadG family protein n=1 Tax=Cerasicoccus frondis TaxID=490090 RepID=UPI002852AFB5|nr:OadG family transporter subunit [Cerasicoccus frondis]